MKVIDLRFTGRQHVRGKPNSTGLKLFCLCDAAGFCCQFWLYLGKAKTYRSASPIDIVIDFAKRLPQPDPETSPSPYCIVVDSYFGSMQLAEELSRMGLTYCLCVKGSKIKDALWTSLCRGLKKTHYRSVYNSKNSICATAFHDRKLIGFISNIKGGGNEDEKGRPEVAAFYNKFMNGVDIFDQQVCVVSRSTMCINHLGVKQQLQSAQKSKVDSVLAISDCEIDFHKCGYIF